LKLLKTFGAVLFLPAAWAIADEPKLKHRDPLPVNGAESYRLAAGQHIPIEFLSTVTLRAAGHADRLYLRTVFPVAVSGRILIPAGSYLDAELMDVRRAGHNRGRAELDVRLGRLTLPNRDERQLDAAAFIRAAMAKRGTALYLAPGTTADMVLRDPIVFPIEEVRSR
jgi:hypothetical protein